MRTVLVVLAGVCVAVLVGAMGCGGDAEVTTTQSAAG